MHVGLHVRFVEKCSMSCDMTQYVYVTYLAKYTECIYVYDVCYLFVHVDLFDSKVKKC